MGEWLESGMLEPIISCPIICHDDRMQDVAIGGDMVGENITGGDGNKRPETEVNLSGVIGSRWRGRLPDPKNDR